MFNLCEIINIFYKKAFVRIIDILIFVSIHSPVKYNILPAGTIRISRGNPFLKGQQVIFNCARRANEAWP